MKARESVMAAEIGNLRQMCDDLKTRAIEARCRSMKYNLLFHGIDEPEEAAGAEDSEQVIKDFIRDKLSIEDADDISLHNVHRIGAVGSRRDDRPRPIIAKFVHYKDLTAVKRSAFPFEKDEIRN